MINFGAGPAALMPGVKESFSESIMQVADSGYSVLELPHRSSHFKHILEELNSLTLSLLGLSSDYHVAWIQGGGRMQFAMLPMNFLKPGMQAGYLNTGYWANDAMKHAQHYGTAIALTSSASDNYGFIPDWDGTVEKDLAYVHLTSNNTIYGTQYASFPKTNQRLVADMSSDIFSRPFDASQFDMIYAVAQKNIGISGVTMVVIHSDMIKEQPAHVPDILSYKSYVEQNSLINTAPVSAIYATLLTLRSYAATGLTSIFEANNMKAQLLYDYLRGKETIRLLARADFSKMNVCFTWGSAEVDSLFVAFAKERDIFGIEGHRRLGGIRVSLYNAITVENVQQLIAVLEEFDVRLR